MADKKETPTTRPTPPTRTSTPPTAKPTTSTARTTAAKPTATPTARTTPTARPTTSTTSTARTTAAKPSATPTARTTPTARPTTSTARTTAAKPTATPTARTTPTARPTTSTTSTARTPAAKTTGTPTAKPTAAATARTTPATRTVTTNAKAKTDNSVESKTADNGKTKTVAATRTEQAKNKKTSIAAARKTSARSGNGGAATATAKNDNKKVIIIAAVCFAVIVALVLGLVFGLRGCASKKGLDNQKATAINSYPAMTKVSFHAEESYDATRNKPVDGVHDEEAAFGIANGYPKYGSTLKAVIGAEEDKVNARQALIAESTYLAAYGTRGANNDGKPNDADKYTFMDKDGYLFRGSVAEPIKAMEVKSYAVDTGEKTYSDVQRRLYKHTASVGLYLGDVADDERAISKKITLANRGYTSYSITGVYAPAGEVLTVRLSGAAMTATGGIKINIGQALYNSQANNIWASKNVMNRIPHVLTTLTLDKNTMTYDEAADTWTGYIGSFIGGPVYVQNEAETFTVEISGGVPYSHFILGYTTPEEFEKNARSSAPMFDLEVWEYGVLHSGPKNYVKNFSYDDLYKAAVYWEKVSLVTTQRGNGYKQGIVFIYDPFVAAGAAVAFPGRSSVNCPLGWMTQSLNYNSMVTSGSWGNMHEYHHNFQGFGVGGGADGEVTNNSLNLVSYALFTNISAKRGISSYGAAGLGGWNNYTVGTWTLNQINNKAITSTNGLAVYATLLHNFGADAFIKNAKGSNLGYWNNWSSYTGYDMSYYANLVSAFATGEKPAANPELPMFVPVSSVYQTGRSYGTGDNKKYITTTRPYVIPYGNEFEIDLSPYYAPDGQYKSGSIVLPTKQDDKQTKRFDYTVTNVTQPEHGKIEKTDDLHYKYIPDKDDKSAYSGKMVVTLKITDTTGAITKIDDVDLVLEFEQTHEMNKTTLDRTTYTYTADNMYTDAVEAYNANFRNYETVVTENQYNPTQNANTDIWFRPDNAQAHKDYAHEPDKYFIHENQIEVVDGKLYFGEDGKYRIYLRGRTNCAMYFSLDGSDYKLGATIKGLPQGYASYQFRLDDNKTYFDAEFKEGSCTVTVYVGDGGTYNYTLKRDDTGEFRNWVYIREVLIDQTLNSVVSFIGAGTAQWVQTMFSLTETYHKANTDRVDSPDAADYAYTQTTYTNQSSVAVAATRSYTGSVLKYYGITGGNYAEITAEKFAELTASKLIEPTSAAYANAYRTTYEFKKNEFTSEYFYTRNHSTDYSDIRNDLLTPPNSYTIVAEETKYTASKQWANGTIDCLTDGTTSSFIHTAAHVTEADPLIITFDMGEAKTANRITFLSRNNNSQGEGPGAFKLLGSLDGVAFFDVTEKSGLPKSKTTIVDFPETTLRYFKVIITSAQNSGTYYIVLHSITLSHYSATVLENGSMYSPDNDMFNYSGNWSQKTVHSNYGHVFVGQNGATIDFSFEGTQLGILSSNSLGQNFEVYIDGGRVDSIELKEDNGTFKYSYISSVLEKGKHSVTVKCTGEANFDSFAVYNNAE